MDIEDSSALIFYTYYMLDWSKIAQTPSEMKCVACGGKMVELEPFRDKKGVVFVGRVCHKCKTVLWVRHTV